MKRSGGTGREKCQKNRLQHDYRTISDLATVTGHKPCGHGRARPTRKIASQIQVPVPCPDMGFQTVTGHTPGPKLKQLDAR
jgi:hypothetical protein